MKKSRYNIEVKGNGKSIVFNTKTRNAVVLDDNEFEMYDIGESNIVKKLSGLGLYVDELYDEYGDVIRTINSNIERDRRNIRSHTIYTTTCCNAHCHYCFEEGFTRESMTLDVAYRIVDYILEHQGDASKLYVIWFGGEPLLNTKVIDLVSNELKKKLPLGVVFRSSIYTNGVLFSDELIGHAITDWNLKAVQITLDGLKTTYEDVKEFNFDNAFDIIIERILAIIATGIRLQVRINYDETNVEEVLELIEYLKDILPKEKKVVVYANRLFRNDKDNFNEISILNDFRIFKKLVECGFCKDTIDSIKNNMNTCLAGSEYSTLFLPSGDIIKCDRDSKSIVGNIYGEVNHSEISKWRDSRISPLCSSCKVFPLCGGGCIYEFLNGKKGCMTSEKLIELKLQYYLDRI